MQLGGNGGASRRRFPLVAFEGGLSHFLSQAGPAEHFVSQGCQALGRLSQAGGVSQAGAAGPGVTSIFDVE